MVSSIEMIHKKISLFTRLPSSKTTLRSSSGVLVMARKFNLMLLLAWRVTKQQMCPDQMESLCKEAFMHLTDLVVASDAEVSGVVEDVHDFSIARVLTQMKAVEQEMKRRAPVMTDHSVRVAQDVDILVGLQEVAEDSMEEVVVSEVARDR
jgi:hypothetical protein